MARGHLRKRAKAPNLWTLVLEIDKDPLTGKRRQRWISFRGTKKQAEEKLAELLAQQAGGTLLIDLSKATVAEFAEHWLRTYVVQQTALKTQASYRGVLRNRVLPTLGTLPLAKLSAAHLRELYTRLLLQGPAGHPLSARSVQQTHAVLRQALAHAVKWRLLSHNVADEVDPPRPLEQERLVWSAVEARRYLGVALENHDYGPALVFALESGVRQEELLGLRWQDVELVEGYVTIQQTISRVQGVGLVRGRGKTAASRRRIALNPTVVAVLREHRARQNERRLLLGPEWEDADLVFCGLRGRPLQPSTIYHAHVRMARQAGVRRIPFHSLRHTHATLLLLANVPVKVVSERLGHASVTITMQIYQHVLPEMQAEATAKLEQLLHGPSPVSKM